MSGRKRWTHLEQIAGEGIRASEAKRAAPKGRLTALHREGLAEVYATGAETDAAQLSKSRRASRTSKNDVVDTAERLPSAVVRYHRQL